MVLGYIHNTRKLVSLAVSFVTNEPSYTDISSGFFINAKERFRDFGGIVYKALDISQDPIAQGFEKHSYDLIVAANVK